MPRDLVGDDWEVWPNRATYAEVETPTPAAAGTTLVASAGARKAANDNALMEPAKAVAAIRVRKSHIWAKDKDEHYVEPAWCSARLFEEERFVGTIYDPACGFGTIVKEACKAGFMAEGSDKIDRGYAADTQCFLAYKGHWDNIVTNPPFGQTEAFFAQAMNVARRKIAFLLPVATINAAWKWMNDTPLRRVWLLTPRPSMPPGHVIKAGIKPAGGRVDYCWCVWDKSWDHGGGPELRWLHRDMRNLTGRAA